MSDPIEDIITGILKAEGEAFTDDPNDRGGATRYGITQDALSEFLGHRASITEIQHLSEADARSIYYDRYVMRPGFGKIMPLSPAIAREVVDTGVNMGVAVAALFLQRVLNAFNQSGTDYPDIPVDGECGTQTVNALKAYLEKRGKEGEQVMLTALNSLQGERYIHIAETRPSQEAFCYGWIRARVSI